MQIREIDKQSDEELRIVTERCMETILETIPEFEGSQVKAKKILPNFDYVQMSTMIAADFSDPSKRIIFATNTDKLVGQILYSVKTDEEGRNYGSFFSAYVLPEQRRHGMAKALLEDSLHWLDEQNVEYVLAQTHITNEKVLSLVKQFGFSVLGPIQKNWSYYTLRLDKIEPNK